jgi:hypothetical protein
LTFNRLSDTSTKDAQPTTPQKRTNAFTDSPKRRYNPFNNSPDNSSSKGKRKANEEIDTIPNGAVQGGTSNEKKDEGQSKKKVAEDDRSVTASPPVAQLVIPYHLLF